MWVTANSVSLQMQKSDIEVGFARGKVRESLKLVQSILQGTLMCVPNVIVIYPIVGIFHSGPQMSQ